MFRRAFCILREAIEKKAFPGVTIAITQEEKLIALRGFGTFTYDHHSAPVTPETIYDLASLTKVLATTMMAMLLFERGQLDLNAAVVNILPQFDSPDAPRKHVTIRMLLAHSSGLPAYKRLFERAKTADELMQSAFQVPLKSMPEARAEYSDIGFIILGELLKRIACEPLDSFCQREIFFPLGMSATTFNPPSNWKPQIPPTVNDPTFRHRMIQGEVHDENASVLGGVAGHAGLFSSAHNLACFAHCILLGGAPILKPETLKMFTTREKLPAGTTRALGWDTPSHPSQSGKYFSPQSFGHLGYTGTLLWIDPERRLSVTLLTNRTWPDCSSQAIKQVRPAFHDEVIEALQDNEEE